MALKITINTKPKNSSAGLVGLLCLGFLLSSCGDNSDSPDAGSPDAEGSAAAVSMPEVPAQAELDAKADQQWAMLNQYCTECHNLDDFSGGLALDLMDHNTITKDAEVWEKVVRKLRGRMMPPPGKERPG